MTLPETNLVPENRPKPTRKRTSIPTIHLQVRTLSFREGNSLIASSQTATQTIPRVRFLPGFQVGETVAFYAELTMPKQVSKKMRNLEIRSFWCLQKFGEKKRLRP